MLAEMEKTRVLSETIVVVDAGELPRLSLFRRLLGVCRSLADIPASYDDAFYAVATV